MNEDTATMLSPAYSDAIGLWKDFSEENATDLEIRMKDRVADNLGTSNLLSCDPPSARNREAYVSIVRQLDAEGSVLDAKRIRMKLLSIGRATGAAP